MEDRKREAERRDAASRDVGTPALQRLFSSQPAVRLRHFAENHRHVVAAAFFFGGFVWDLLTLQRIDAWFDNTLLSLYLIALTGLIFVSARAHFGDRPGGEILPRLRRLRPALRDAVQFLMGALFSAFVVFYGRSASLSRTSAYLTLLIVLLVANEFVHRRLFNVTLQVSLYFLAAASFLIFLLPVLLAHVGYASFVAACCISALLAAGLATALNRRINLPGRRPLATPLLSVLTLAALLNVFYLTNLIPPVPLAMKFGGVYHNVSRDGSSYELWYESPPWYMFWSRTSNPFHYLPGESVYCFAAVFAPTDLKEKVFHTWLYRPDGQGDWIQTDRIGYQVTGGRDGGYRGFTVKRAVEPGEWKILVEDERGFVLGRIKFDVVMLRDGERPLKRTTYY